MKSIFSWSVDFIRRKNFYIVEIMSSVLNWWTLLTFSPKSNKCHLRKLSPIYSTHWRPRMLGLCIFGKRNIMLPCSISSRPRGFCRKESRGSRTKISSCSGSTIPVTAKPSHTTWHCVFWQQNRKRLSKCSSQFASVALTFKTTNGGIEWAKHIYKVTMNWIVKKQIRQK